MFIVNTSKYLSVILVFLFLSACFIPTTIAGDTEEASAEITTKTLCFISAALDVNQTTGLPPVILPIFRVGLSWEGIGITYVQNLFDSEDHFVVDGEQNAYCIGFFGIGGIRALVGYDTYLFVGVALFLNIESETGQ